MASQWIWAARINTETALEMLDSNFDNSEFGSDLYGEDAVTSWESTIDPGDHHNLELEEQQMTGSGSDECRASEEVNNGSIEPLEASAGGGSAETSVNCGILLNESPNRGQWSQETIGGETGLWG